jgi:hypothetical protein
LPAHASSRENVVGEIAASVTKPAPDASSGLQPGGAHSKQSVARNRDGPLAMRHDDDCSPTGFVVAASADAAK